MSFHLASGQTEKRKKKKTSPNQLSPLRAILCCNTNYKRIALGILWPGFPKHHLLDNPWLWHVLRELKHHHQTRSFMNYLDWCHIFTNILLHSQCLNMCIRGADCEINLNISSQDNWNPTVLQWLNKASLIYLRMMFTILTYLTSHLPQDSCSSVKMEQFELGTLCNISWRWYKYSNCV